MQDAMASGHFWGHVLPGIAFLVWGVWWLLEVVWAGEPRPAGSALERSLVAPLTKLAVVPVGLWAEVPNSGWEPMDAVMGWHHSSVYIGVGLAAIVDLLERRGLVSARATYLALAAAMLNAALLFFGHGNGPGVEAVSHQLLATTFLGVGVFAVLEVAVPRWRLEWFRIGAMVALGAWFVVIGWVLFRSGWDLHDHVREGWVYVLYSWTVMAVSALVAAVAVWIHGRADRTEGPA